MKKLIFIFSLVFIACSVDNDESGTKTTDVMETTKKIDTQSQSSESCASSCLGCCKNGVCYAGDSKDACGLFGEECRTCSSAQICAQGECVVKFSDLGEPCETDLDCKVGLSCEKEPVVENYQCFKDCSYDHDICNSDESCIPERYTWTKTGSLAYMILPSYSSKDDFTYWLENSKSICVKKSSPYDSWQIKFVYANVLEHKEDGTPWDAMGGAPDLQACVFYENDQYKCNSPVEDSFEAVWSSPIITLKSKDMKDIAFCLYDKDISQDDLVECVSGDFSNLWKNHKMIVVGQGSKGILKLFFVELIPQ